MMLTVTDKYQSKMCDKGKLNGQTPEIREFFAGRKVFITGGTGFLGAVLLEKLLRACPEIETVYLLVRPKRMSSVQDRVSTLLDSPVSEVAHRLKHILTKTSFALETELPATLSHVGR
jgi:hypothetical protein